MGKFPAPLLMNTVHFSMQAILSKAIIWFWSHRFQHTVSMSWRDYYVRGNLTNLCPSLSDFVFEQASWAISFANY